MQYWIGNSESMKVHDWCCQYAEEMWPGNRVEFEMLHHALALGYEEAACCLTDRPMRLVYSAPNVRAKRAERGCLICGEKRAVQHAHVLPRGSRFTMTIELCATHHWTYDSGSLTESEFRELYRRVMEIHGRRVAKHLYEGHGAVRSSGTDE